MTVVIACVQYQPEVLPDWAAYGAKLERLVRHAASAGARLVVFPEYAGMEIANLLSAADRQDVARSVEAAQGMLRDVLALHADMARRHGVTIVAGSLPVRVDGDLRNRAHVFSPSGTVMSQDKLTITRGERERLGLSGGDAVTVFRAAWGTFAVALGYDIEFPPVARVMVEAGAEIILVPSYSTTVADFQRVRACARARAVENQSYVAHAPLVGALPWSSLPGTGTAAVFSPCDTGFPSDGILARATSEQLQLVVARLDFALIERVRAEGEVRNLLRQREIEAKPAPRVETVGLG
ncbi:MAG: carbon-nitrogen hydrolase [Magnetospirillum sp.]|nr:carbon-nitrogen hydrolase [Magnetospirillum sp.]